MITVTDEQIAEWRRLSDAATSGPWRATSDGDWVGYVIAAKRRTTIAICEASEVDMDFIAAAREAVPALLAEIERLRAATRDREAVILLTIEFLRKSAHECMEAHEKRDAEFMKWLKNKRGQQPAPMVALPIAASMMRDAADALSAAIAQRAAEGNE